MAEGAGPAGIQPSGEALGMEVDALSEKGSIALTHRVVVDGPMTIVLLDYSNLLRRNRVPQAQPTFKQINHLDVIVRKAVAHENNTVRPLQGALRFIPDARQMRVAIVLAMARRYKNRPQSRLAFRALSPMTILVIE